MAGPGTAYNMDDQTKLSNDLYNDNGGDQQQDRPLTNFLQTRQAVKVVEEEPAEDDTSIQADDAPFLEESAEEQEAGGGKQEDEEGGEAEEEQKTEKLESTPEIDHNKLNTALKALKLVEQQVATVIKLLETGDSAVASGELIAAGVALPAPVTTGPKGGDVDALKPIDGRVVEGVFDGRGMVGADGKSYMVPPNYASKSKLVEGDMLKLTITPKGSFIYKQIGPIERSRLIGSLGFDQTTGEYYATSENRRWNVIKASVTYFKGEPGDEVVLLVPKNAPSKWAAVENIIKRNPLG